MAIVAPNALYIRNGDRNGKNPILYKLFSIIFSPHINIPYYVLVFLKAVIPKEITIVWRNRDLCSARQNLENFNCRAQCLSCNPIYFRAFLWNLHETWYDTRFRCEKSYIICSILKSSSHGILIILRYF